MSTDNRTHPRFPLDVRVNYDFNAIAHTKDISEGGICIITDQPMEKGKLVHLLFILPTDSKEIKAFGKTMWNKQASEHLFENGVSFWEILDKDRDKIKNYFTD